MEVSKFIQTYQAIVASTLSVTIVVIGWIINHQLTLRAQYKNAEQQYYNTARVELSSVLKEYKQFLHELTNHFINVANSLVSEENVDYNSFKQLLDNTKHKWIHSLLEYQTLLPDLEIVHSVLTEREAEIESFAVRILFAEESKQRKVAIETRRYLEFLNTQKGLVDDVLLYLQNKCFSRITGNMISNQLLSSNTHRPRFIINKGKLEYVQPKDYPY